jgi:hypothetical protein
MGEFLLRDKEVTSEKISLLDIITYSLHPKNVTRVHPRATFLEKETKWTF